MLKLAACALPAKAIVTAIAVPASATRIPRKHILNHGHEPTTRDRSWPIDNRFADVVQWDERIVMKDDDPFPGKVGN